MRRFFERYNCWIRKKSNRLEKEFHYITVAIERSKNKRPPILRSWIFRSQVMPGWKTKNIML